MNFRNIKSNSGFTLIEVMIALVVAVIGILAMIQLSGVFLKSVADAEQRTIAYALAERTLEDLRGFDSLTGTEVSESYFENIATGSSANVTVASGQASYEFDVVWTVTDNIVSGGVVSPGASGAVYKRLKEVDVVVSWTNPEAGSVSLSSMIGGVDPNAAALTSNDLTNIGGESPQVEYTPGVAPEVIAVDVGNGLLKETTKPVPEVASKDYSTEVKFETITYNPSDSNFQEIQEDFITVNCICNLVASGESVSPAYLEYESDAHLLINVLGETVSSATGTEGTLGGGNSQSEFCSRCCANHHDSSSSTVKYSPDAGNASDGHDHRHYKITNDTTDPLTLAEAVAGDDYLEACRFKRINGIYRLVPDWNILEVNVFPSNYLAASTAELTAYQAYIQDYVVSAAYSQLGSNLAATAGISASISQPSLTMDTTVNSSDQALSRSIYMENLSTVENLSAYLLSLSASSIASDSTSLILGVLPFYEVNTSELSYWTSASDAIATVSNDAINTGSFERGGIDAIAAGSTEITASMAQGNTGILGNTFSATSPTEFAGKDNRITSAATRSWISNNSYNPMPVTVSGAVIGLPYTITVQGTVTDYGTLFKTGDVDVACSGGGTPGLVEGAVGNYMCTIADVPFGSTVNVSVIVTTNSKDAACDPGAADHADTSSYQLPVYSGITAASANITGADFDVSEVIKVGNGPSATYENSCP